MSPTSHEQKTDRPKARRLSAPPLACYTSHKVHVAIAVAHFAAQISPPSEPAALTRLARQGAGKPPATMPKPVPLDDAWPRQQCDRNFFHVSSTRRPALFIRGLLFFATFIRRAANVRNPALDTAQSSPLRVSSNPAVSRKPRCAAVWQQMDKLPAARNSLAPPIIGLVFRPCPNRKHPQPLQGEKIVSNQLTRFQTVPAFDAVPNCVVPYADPRPISRASDEFSNPDRITSGQREV